MPEATGQLRDGSRIAISRAFDAPIERIWAAGTDPSLLERWYGTWTGDPASGEVILAVTSEGDTEGSPLRIDECHSPDLLRVTTLHPVFQWRLALELGEADGVTTLTLVQDFDEGDDVSSIGPGWEYYLDRLVTVEAGGDPSEVDFERDYFPAQQQYYRDLGAAMTF